MIAVWRLVLMFVLAAALVVAPGAFDASAAGAPLGAAGRWAICLLFLLWVFTRFFPPRRGPGWWGYGILAALIVAKVIIGAFSTPSGWRGEYRFADQRGVMCTAEFFWRFGSHRFRIDRALAFDAGNFDLHFLNDSQRFNTPPFSTTRREVEFPLDVEWTGHVALAEPARVTFTADARGGLIVGVDGEARSFDKPSGAAWSLDLPAGPHVIEVAYRKPAGAEPAIALEMSGAPTAAPIVVTPWPASAAPGRAAAAATDISVLAGLALLIAVIAGLYARGGAAVEPGSVLVRAMGFGAVALIAFWTARLAVSTLGTTAFLQSGNDPLGYASDARDILHHGILMLRGQALGDAMPFYTYPFYPYLLAPMHALVGEDASTIYLLNGLALAALPLLFWRLGWRSVTPLAAGAGFFALVVFVARYCWPIAAGDQPSFTDIVFMTVVFAALVVLERAYAQPQPARLVTAGVLVGLAAATRPSFLTMVGFAPIGLYLAMGGGGKVRAWFVRCAWLVAGVFLGLLPFTLRNLVVSGHFVVLVNSWIQLPYFLIPPELVRSTPPFDRVPPPAFTLSQAILTARDIFLRDPLGTLWVETRKLLFTFGLTAFGPSGHWGGKIVILPVLFAGSAALRRIPRVVLIVLLTFGASHVVAMIMAAPWTSGPKTILPLHAAFLFGAAYLLDGVRLRRATTRERSVPAA